MEDILASIRRILSEDEADPPAAAQSPPQPDVLALDSSMLVNDPLPGLSTPRHPAEPPKPQFMEAPAAPALHVVAPPPPEPRPPSVSLMGDAAASAAASSVGSLLRTLASERQVAVHRGGPTLEDLVREEMRPLLKDWLDNNLPPLVERLVRAEIERVVGRALS